MSTERYNPRVVEPRWQSVWNERRTFETATDDPRPKYYVLEMFPYPSGRIHMGHVRNYTMGDVLARYWRARGYNVLHPMGWDAFGLPAENAAQQKKVHPKEWTYENIAAMRAQLKSMGLSLDWSTRVRHLRRRILRAAAAALPRLPRRRPRGAEDRQGELGSGRPDRAGQRAGHRRNGLALRRAGRGARADAMVLHHHQLQRGPARRAEDARPLAG